MEVWCLCTEKSHVVYQRKLKETTKENENFEFERKEAYMSDVHVIFV